MATREEREAALAQAVKTLESWPRWMHSVACGCSKCAAANSVPTPKEET